MREKEGVEVNSGVMLGLWTRKNTHHLLPRDKPPQDGKLHEHLSPMIHFAIYLVAGGGYFMLAPHEAWGTIKVLKATQD